MPVGIIPWVAKGDRGGIMICMYRDGSFKLHVEATAMAELLSQKLLSTIVAGT
jgi:hypothetical protein